MHNLKKKRHSGVLEFIHINIKVKNLLLMWKQFFLAIIFLFIDQKGIHIEVTNQKNKNK